MKIMSDKKFRKLIIEKDKEHINHIHELCDKYERSIDSLSDRNLDFRIEINNLKRQLNELENHKTRYLKMIENKKFKTKRLNKKYAEKLVREIELLFGGSNENEF